ncbi:hypothetical protein GGI12_006150, partial [Dipsacomyces acuminosporus]
AYLPEYQHMALFTSNDKGATGKVYEITGASGFFQYHTRHVSMHKSKGIENVYLVKENCADISIHAQHVRVNNWDNKWNCQFWVSDALELFRDRGILNY